MKFLKPISRERAKEMGLLDKNPLVSIRDIEIYVGEVKYKVHNPDWESQREERDYGVGGER